MNTADDIRNATSHDAAEKMVRTNLAASDQWLIRGLLAIYKRQTADEQATQSTRHLNGIGFNGLDAGILSSFAKQVQRWQQTPAHLRRFDSPQSAKQLNIARKKMSKYAGQLARVARDSQPAS